MDYIISCSIHISEITAIKYSQPSVFSEVEPADMESPLPYAISYNGLEHPQSSVSEGGSRNRLCHLHQGKRVCIVFYFDEYYFVLSS